LQYIFHIDYIMSLLVYKLVLVLNTYYCALPLAHLFSQIMLHAIQSKIYYKLTSSDNIRNTRFQLGLVFLSQIKVT